MGDGRRHRRAESVHDRIETCAANGSQDALREALSCAREMAAEEVVRKLCEVEVVNVALQ